MQIWTEHRMILDKDNVRQKYIKIIVIKMKLTKDSFIKEFIR